MYEAVPALIIPESFQVYIQTILQIITKHLHINVTVDLTQSTNLPLSKKSHEMRCVHHYNAIFKHAILMTLTIESGTRFQQVYVKQQAVAYF